MWSLKSHLSFPWNDRIELTVCSTKVACSSFGEELSWNAILRTFSDTLLSFLNIICNHVQTTRWIVSWISHRREFVLAKHSPDEVAYSWSFIERTASGFYSKISLIQCWSTATGNKLCKTIESLLNLSKYFAFVMDFMIESGTPGICLRNLCKLYEHSNVCEHSCRVLFFILQTTDNSWNIREGCKIVEVMNWSGALASEQWAFLQHRTEEQVERVTGVLIKQ